jgi:hypothetical protein
MKIFIVLGLELDASSRCLEKKNTRLGEISDVLLQRAKIDVMWDIAPYCLLEIDRRFGDTYCFHHRTMISMMIFNFCQTKRCNISEDCYLQTLLFALSPYYTP